MNYTNKHNLPPVIAEALMDDRPWQSREGKISVTELIGPPIMRQLRIAHDQTVTTDVASQVYRLLGQGVHAVLKNANALGSTAEQWLTAHVCGWDINGIPDCLDRDGWLNDFKVVSAFAFLLGDKPEWEAQLNVYDFLCRENGFEVSQGLRIIAIIRDWTQYQADKNPDYPQCPVLVKRVSRWTEAEQRAYIEERVTLHQTWEHHPVEAIPPCSPEERWQSQTKFAVRRTTNKKAMRLFDTEAEALEFIGVQDPKFAYVIDVRESKPKRCLDYCDYAPYCPLGRAVREQNETNTEEE